MKRLLLASVFVLLPATAFTQPVCAPVEQAEAMLKQYAEVRLGAGASKAGHLLEIHVNPETRTWSVIGRSPQLPGQLCLLDAGDGWEFGASGEGRPGPESK